MSFVERYLKNPYLITSLIILGVVLGFLSFREMPLNLFPDANYPKIAVVLVWPGASAEDVEDKVARRVEKELATLDLVRKVQSSSRDEVAAVSVEFEYEKGLDSAEVDVSAALNRIWASLPKGLLPARIFRVSDATAPVCTLAVYPKPGAPLDLAKVRQLADNELREALLRIPEVAQVEVFGGYFPEVRLEVDRDKLARYGLNLSQVISAIYAENLNIPGGLLIRSHDQILIKVAGERLEKQKLLDLVVARTKNGEIHLRDIARLKTLYAERESLFHGNGRPAIGINILRPEKGHVTVTLAGLHRELPKIKKMFPELSFEVADTQENLIRTSISNMIDALRDAVVLTVGVIFIILARWRMTLLAAISIPFTYFMTFFGMRLLGFELNIVTLTAVIVAVGLLLDDAIVVIENIDRHHHLGKPPFQAAVDGTKEIWLADFAGTITTVAVLVPILFIGGYVEKILRQFASVLILALLSSYVVSITVIPLLSQKILRGDARRNAFERLLYRVSEGILEPLRNFFVALFDFAVTKRLLFIGPLGIGLLVLSLKQMPLVGKDLMPPMDTGIIKISFETEANTSLAQTEKIVNQMEEIIRETPGFIRMATMVGSEPGVISFGAERTPQQGLITVHFIDRFHRKETIWQIEEELREKFLRIPGLRYVHVYDFGATPLSSIAAPVDVMISGPDPKVLDRLAEEVKTRLYKVRGLVSISRNWTLEKREIELVLNLEKLARYKVSPLELASTVRAAFSGAAASVLRVPGEDGYVIRVRFPEGERRTLSDLKTLKIPTPEGPVPLNELATFQEVRTLTVYKRQGLSPVVDVLGYRYTTAITHLQGQVNRLLADLPLPPGYRISQEGESKHMGESFSRLKKALILALVLLYFSLVPTFKSFLDPLTIMVAIPLSLIGAVWGLLIVGRHFCMPAAMGMILLAGIVVNNSILLIDFIKRARAEGKGRREAIEGAIRIRTRPIIMTAMGTITGMLPIAAERALGLERLSPLAVVAIGGLLVATLLTLLYVPLFYTLFEDLKKKIRRIRGNQ
ncbi:efflux RND transporter permease subunit [Thermosulfuriphilus ammonigenes]|uniref:Efflux RND transporter permease subunit n=1 Tax=Thermosulfuriphilus ammonigenes TaxID=1936021 RepID=A0A6G7PVB7_9BACT|nr:efflux RND transporter permease subunit [Thermosulfuriphilus ammonigenes]MBA2848461.1 multidrug efflux pump subunit AcrB [Thermosulfuriphilus ammonigenes]QIJ71388.1 efflux RND transporter permease subunit [Thermosulfuriphilus ammonigenes]